MRTRFYLALLCLFVAHLSLAQDFRLGYIKLKDGKDQHGLIGKIISGYPERVEYKADESSEVVRYSANDVSGYGIDNGIYYSSFQEPGVSGGWNFVEILVQGDLILVRRSNFYFLVDRNGSKVVHLNEKLKLRVRSMMMKGCPFIASQSMKLDRAGKELIAHVEAYNKCVAVRKPNYDGVRNPVRIGIMAGVDNSTASFTEYKKRTSAYLTGGELVDGSFFQAGIDATFRHRGLSNYFGVYTGLLYNSNSYSQSNKIVFPQFRPGDPISTEYNEYTIEFTQLKVPIGIEFAKPSLSKIQPHIRIGLIISKTLDLKVNRSVYDIDPRSDGNIYPETPPEMNYFKVKPSFMIGGGLDYRVLDNHFIRLHLSYTTGIAETNTGGGVEQESTPGKFTSLNGMIGFIF